MGTSLKQAKAILAAQRGVSASDIIDFSESSSDISDRQSAFLIDVCASLRADSICETLAAVRLGEGEGAGGGEVSAAVPISVFAASSSTSSAADCPSVPFDDFDEDPSATGASSTSSLDAELVEPVEEAAGGGGAGNSPSDDTKDPLVLAVCHGGFIKKFLSTFCGLNVAKIANGSLSVVKVKVVNGKVKCFSEESRVNYSSHIEDLEIKCGHLFL